MKLPCTADTPDESLVHRQCEAGEAMLNGEAAAKQKLVFPADTRVPCQTASHSTLLPDAAQVGAVTSAPGKGLDKVRSAAHKMHLGKHSNEPCQLLLRVSPQGVCNTKSLWAQFFALGPGVPPHISLGCGFLLLCLLDQNRTVVTNLMCP